MRTSKILQDAMNAVLADYSKISAGELMARLDSIQPGPLSTFLTDLDPGYYARSLTPNVFGIKNDFEDDLREVRFPQNSKSLVAPQIESYSIVLEDQWQTAAA
jgi:hypothetical protein